MNKKYIMPKDELRGELYRRICFLIRKNRGTWQSLGAAFGIAGGMLSIILGAGLWIIVTLAAPGSLESFLNAVDTLLFALSLPLLALCAYCLDLLEKKPPVLPLTARFQPGGVERLMRLRPPHPRNN